MGIVKYVDKEDESRFARLPNDLLRDKTLSWSAIGLLAHIHSHKEGFNITIRSLTKASKAGQTATETALKELREAGYIHFAGRKLEKGKFTSSIWNVYLKPIEPDPTLKTQPENPDEEDPNEESTNQGTSDVYKEDYPKEDYLKKTNDKYIAIPKNRENDSQQIIPFKKQRPRDLIFEALCQACHINMKELTQSSRGPLNKVVKELKEVNATPEEILFKAKILEAKLSVAITPISLAKHWPSLNEEAIKSIVTNKQREKLLNEHIGSSQQEAARLAHEQQMYEQGIIDEQGNYIEPPKQKEIY